MSLITRCPACGTMFKVVTDQLKVSQGWVRCGHCSEVFDATLHLQTVQPPQELVSTPTFDHEQPHFQQQPEPQGQPAWSPGGFLADGFQAPPAPSVPPRNESFAVADASDVGYDVDPS
ncbi:MAG: zinc-ribbon domain-containing protein, partial [Polaromonas sp.]